MRENVQSFTHLKSKNCAMAEECREQSSYEKAPHSHSTSFSRACKITLHFSSSAHFLSCSFNSVVPFIECFMSSFPLCYNCHVVYSGFGGEEEACREKAAMFKTRLVWNERGLADGRKGFMTLFEGDFLAYCKNVVEVDEAKAISGVIPAVPHVAFVCPLSLSTSKDMLMNVLKCFTTCGRTIIFGGASTRARFEEDFNTLLAMGYGSTDGVAGAKIITEIMESGGENGIIYYVVEGSKGGGDVTDGIGVVKQGDGGQRAKGAIPKVLQDVLQQGGKAYYI